LRKLYTKLSIGASYHISNNLAKFGFREDFFNIECNIKNTIGICVKAKCPGIICFIAVTSALLL
jgi:hypothetical protein